jgi:hypothetical protein
MYPVFGVDADGKKLNGANLYTLHFAPGQLPPVNAFWSLTMYELPASLLVANPINRYLINSPMLPQLNRDINGGLTLLVQNGSPGRDKEANWLPAPKGPFIAYMRLYWQPAKVTVVLATFATAPADCDEADVAKAIVQVSRHALPQAYVSCSHRPRTRRRGNRQRISRSRSRRDVSGEESV